MPVTVRPLEAADLPAADRIFRLAFGTHLRLPDPLTFGGDSDFVATRWRAEPAAAVGADRDGRLLGSNFVTAWGRVGFFGPLTVHPEAWNAGVARQLLARTMDLLERRGVAHAGLFTFADSAKHVTLYGRFGFAPRFLTAIASKAVVAGAPAPGWLALSTVPEAGRAAWVGACRALTGAVFEGLDVTREIDAVLAQRLGDVVLVHDDGALRAMAVCHVGPGTEAGSGACYVKFGAAHPGPEAAAHLGRLLAACEAFAAGAGQGRLVAGVNTARAEAYRALLAHGFRTEIQGVAMQRPNEPGYNRPGVFALDDWR